MDWINHWTWFAAASVLIVLELFLPGVVFLWLGFAAAVVAVILLLVPEWGLGWQLLTFSVLGVIFAVLGRYWLSKNPLKSESPLLNHRAEQYVGRTAVLPQAIKNGEGYINIDDTRWRVTGDDLSKGTKIKIIGFQNATLTVEECNDS